MGALQEDYSSEPTSVIDVPQPTGWAILIMPYISEEKSQGGIILPDDVQNANRHLNIVGEVIAMGDLCYTDDRFAIGDRTPKAWCKVGDWVTYPQNIGSRFTVYDENNDAVEFILLNDDNIRSVVKDPRNIRAYV